MNTQGLILRTIFGQLVVVLPSVGNAQFRRQMTHSTRVFSNCSTSLSLQSFSMSPPELLLGRNGVYRISILGNSGSGKSTLGHHLSKHLQVPHLSINELFWNPGWVPTQLDVLRDQVQKFIESNPDGWIVDGNYTQMIGSIVQDAATDVLWLDPPILINFWRVLWCTFGRLFLGEPSCAPGCDEDIRETLGSKNSILWYCLSHHRTCRKEFGPIWERESMEAGKGKWRRFGGWGGELGRWLGQVTTGIRNR